MIKKVHSEKLLWETPSEQASIKMTAAPSESPEPNSDDHLEVERKNSKEAIHSGHFMVSDFEAEAQDAEGLEVPEQADAVEGVEEIQGVTAVHQGGVITYAKAKKSDTIDDATTVCIDASLTKLFKTMTLAYKQNITSPKWNGFKGLKLRWKDKIRLNNIIWRCWHMQYIMKKKMNVCQFTLDVDIHTRPGITVLEGKYWKRQVEAITAEYKKWRLYYKSSPPGGDIIQDQDLSFFGLEEMDWAKGFFNSQCQSAEAEDLLQSMDFTDMIFSSSNTSPQLFPFPNPREIARGTGNSDLQQPGLMQLQPDLTDSDIMDFQEMLSGKGLGLATVPEEDFLSETASLQTAIPSPPAVSSPIEYTARLTTTHVFSSSPTGSSLPLTEPFSQELMLPAQGPLKVSFQDPRFCPRQETSFSRSRSEQELDAHCSANLQHDTAFAVPKNIPRRRSHSGSVPYVSPNHNHLSQAISSPNLQTIQVSSLSPLPQRGATPRKVSEPSTLYTNSDSALLAHLLKSDSCTPHSVVLPLSSVASNNENDKRPRDHFATTPIANSSNGIRGGCGNSLNNRSNHANTNLASVTASIVQPPLLLPTVSLSAVTPSSLKAIPVSSQVSNWSSSGLIKTSPTYTCEPLSLLSYPGVSSPTNKTYRPKNECERAQYKEKKKRCHINAEQKRRCNIKNNFDMLQSLIPSVCQSSTSKVSKATMLQKGADYILQLKQDKQLLLEQAEQLRNQIETLNTDISTAQSLLPATGAPMNHTRHNKMRDKYEAYVSAKTQENYKYFILALVAEPLMESFNSSVSTASVDDLCRSSMAWLDQHCSLNVLRPVVSNAMRKLSTTTNILNNPQQLAQEITDRVLVTKKENTFSR